MAGHLGTSTRRDTIEQLEGLIDARLRDHRVAMKATVGAYDAGSQKATVTPKLEMTVAGQKITAPDIDSVKVIHPRGGGYGLHFPHKAGDGLTLIALDRPAQSFNADGSNQDVAQGRIGDLSNVVALPGGYDDTRPMTNVPSNGMFVGSDDGKRGVSSKDDGTVSMKGGPSGTDKIKIGADGKVDIMGEDGDSLLQIVKDLAMVFRNHTNTGAALDSPFVTAADAIIARIDAMKA